MDSLLFESVHVWVDVVIFADFVLKNEVEYLNDNKFIIITLETHETVHEILDELSFFIDGADVGVFKQLVNKIVNFWVGTGYMNKFKETKGEQL